MALQSAVFSRTRTSAHASLAFTVFAAVCECPSLVSGNMAPIFRHNDIPLGRRSSHADKFLKGPRMNRLGGELNG